MKKMDSVVRESVEVKNSVEEMAKVQKQILAKLTELYPSNAAVLLTGQSATPALVEGCASERVKFSHM